MCIKHLILQAINSIIIHHNTWVSELLWFFTVDLFIIDECIQHNSGIKLSYVYSYYHLNDYMSYVLTFSGFLQNDVIC